MSLLLRLPHLGSPLSPLFHNLSLLVLIFLQHFIFHQHLLSEFPALIDLSDYPRFYFCLLPTQEELPEGMLDPWPLPWGLQSVILSCTYWCLHRRQEHWGCYLLSLKMRWSREESVESGITRLVSCLRGVIFKLPTLLLDSPWHTQLAVLLYCSAWIPPKTDTVVVALFLDWGGAHGGSKYESRMLVTTRGQFRCN